MFVIEPKSTVKYLAVVEGVISIGFLILLIILRLHATATGIVPEWIVELNFFHWSRNYHTTVNGSNGFLIFSLFAYYAFLSTKFGLAILLWRWVPKDYFSRNSRRLLHWIWATIAINLIGIGLLALLNYSTAFEVTLAKIFSIMTCFLDMFCVVSVLWLRRVIQLHTTLCLGIAGQGSENQGGAYVMHDARTGTGNGYGPNPNHNLRPCTLF